MDHFVRAVRFVSQLCGYVAAALITCGVVIVCQMVFVRYVLNENTIWQTDFVTYSLVAATFIGSPYVLMTGIAGLLAVALLGAITVGVFGAVLDERLRALQIPAAARVAMHDEARKLTGAEVPPVIDPAKREAVQHALEESFVQSFRATALIAACLALMSAACAWLTIDLHAVHARSR